MLSSNNGGGSIKSNYGVVHRRASSGTLYSLYVSDMTDALRDVHTGPPHNLALIADDTMVVAEFPDSFRIKLEAT